jgi:hypothetical protein
MDWKQHVAYITGSVDQGFLQCNEAVVWEDCSRTRPGKLHKFF